MRWKGRPTSSNVEDRRGMGGAAMGGIGGILGLIFLLVYTFLGGSPGDIVNNIPINQGSNKPYVETAEEKELSEFVSVVLKDTEIIWTGVLKEIGEQYRVPTLVLYTGSVQSACGVSGSSTGPFYCPGDEKVYIDLSFFQELRDKYKAPGDFAIAYVVAHEVGHHVQKILGITDQIDEIRNQVNEKEFNKYSISLELQADYLAGVWAYHAEKMGLLEEGDLQEALKAASAVGDDTIQKRSQGYTIPDSFTHGTSEQRQRWFTKGFKTGNLDNWDTFNSKDL